MRRQGAVGSAILTPFSGTIHGIELQPWLDLIETKLDGHYETDHLMALRAQQMFMRAVNRYELQDEVKAFLQAGWEGAHLSFMNTPEWTLLISNSYGVFKIVEERCSSLGARCVSYATSWGYAHLPVGMPRATRRFQPGWQTEVYNLHAFNLNGENENNYAE